MKLLKKLGTHKILVSALFAIIQIIVIFFLTVRLSLRFSWIYVFLELTGLFFVLRLRLKYDENPAFNIAWIMIILLIPIVGPVTYMLFGNRKIPKALRKQSSLNKLIQSEDLFQNPITLQMFKEMYPQWNKLISYLSNTTHYPLYRNTKCDYYGTGEESFEAILEEVSKAKTSIFLEYFIIKPGFMYDELMKILVEKASVGVDVRIIFDDYGCPWIDNQVLEDIRSKNIKIVPFNPLGFKSFVQLNNRDHRKILIIDGQVGFVSGINIADEYINKIERFGYWKDNAVRISGNAVLSLIEMFLVVWDFCNQTTSKSMKEYIQAIEPDVDEGFVLPFSDCPTDEYNVMEAIHLMSISNAKKSIKIVTPYLVIGYEMFSALKNAALSGVQVDIVVPGIPDKKFVYALTELNYEKLVKVGVKIHRYTPGFIHQKMIIVDDELSIISSANMDFRSYYLNFECGIIFFSKKVYEQCLKDIVKSISESETVSMQQINSIPLYRKIYRLIVGIFVQLM